MEFANAIEGHIRLNRMRNQTGVEESSIKYY